MLFYCCFVKILFCLFENILNYYCEKEDVFLKMSVTQCYFKLPKYVVYRVVQNRMIGWKELCVFGGFFLTIDFHRSSQNLWNARPIQKREQFKFSQPPRLTRELSDWCDYLFVSLIFLVRGKENFGEILMRSTRNFQGPSEIFKRDFQELRENKLIHSW